MDVQIEMQVFSSSQKQIKKNTPLRSSSIIPACNNKKHKLNSTGAAVVG